MQSLSAECLGYEGFRNSVLAVSGRKKHCPGLRAPYFTGPSGL